MIDSGQPGRAERRVDHRPHEHQATQTRTNVRYTASMRRNLDPEALARLPKDQRLALLRKSIASVPGHVGATATMPADDELRHNDFRDTDNPRQVDTIAEAVGKSPSTPVREVITLPGALGELMPDGGLAHGTTAACPRGALICAMLAAASGAGRDVAIISEHRRPQIGLLAAWEMGADLDHIACVGPVPPDQAGDVVSILADGAAMVILDIPAARLPRSRVEVLRAKLRATGAVLVATGGGLARRPHIGFRIRRGPDVGLGAGTGRVSRLDLHVQVWQQSLLWRTGHIVCTSAGSDRMQWVRPTSPEATTTPSLARTG